MKVLVTGGAGFIGSAYIRHLLKTTDHQIINLDSLTYASNVAAIPPAPNHRYTFALADIRFRLKIREVFAEHRPDAVIHFAAESHVDRSISGPGAFIDTNIVGTFNLLEESREHDVQRFLHVSTDEVYGSLRASEKPFTEESPYAPNSPYSSSKAASDHLVRAWYKTYGFPAIITHCSNNYGPFQFPEKLIPLVIKNALELKKIPVYGKGNNIRDWIYVEDHVEALHLLLERGRPGETYNIGGNCEVSNIDMVEAICGWLQKLHPSQRYIDLIEYVKDRPGHDFRYAINNDKMHREFNWHPKTSLGAGLNQTIQWYVKEFFK